MMTRNYCLGFLRSHGGSFLAAIATATENLTLDPDGTDFWNAVLVNLRNGIRANA